jgi:hypothetical protein
MFDSVSIRKGLGFRAEVVDNVREHEHFSCRRECDRKSCRIRPS